MTQPVDVEFTRIPGGALRVEGHGITSSDLRAALYRWLQDVDGREEFDADNIAYRRAEFGRGWWSDTYNGSTHDCASHAALGATPGPFCADSRAVTFVSNVGVDEWAEYVRA